MMIFEISRKFPAEEKFAMISQIRRSSRSVCMNLREAWAKRRYEAHFILKLTDCVGENSETETSPDYALACSYITKDQHTETKDQHTEMTSLSHEIGRMLNSMTAHPEKFAPRQQAS